MITPDEPPYCSEIAVVWKYFLLGGLLYLGERIVRIPSLSLTTPGRVSAAGLAVTDSIAASTERFVTTAG